MTFNLIKIVFIFVILKINNWRFLRSHVIVLRVFDCLHVSKWANEWWFLIDHSPMNNISFISSFQTMTMVELPVSLTTSRLPILSRNVFASTKRMHASVKAGKREREHLQTAKTYKNNSIFSPYDDRNKNEIWTLFGTDNIFLCGNIIYCSQRALFWWKRKTVNRREKKINKIKTKINKRAVLIHWFALRFVSADFGRLSLCILSIIFIAQFFGQFMLTCLTEKWSIYSECANIKT